MTEPWRRPVADALTAAAAGWAIVPEGRLLWRAGGQDARLRVDRVDGEPVSTLTITSRGSDSLVLEVDGLDLDVIQ